MSRELLVARHHGHRRGDPPWCLKFGQDLPPMRRVRRRVGRPSGDLDEVYLRINANAITCGGRWIRTVMCWTSVSASARPAHNPTLFPANASPGLRDVPQVSH